MKWILIRVLKHKVVRKTVREFAETEIGPHVSDMNREGRFPREVIETMRSLNYFGLQIPKAYGGADMDSISYAITIEELSRVSAAIGLCITVHNSVGAFPIVRFGTLDQKQRFLPHLASGEWIGAFCLSEANAGSDAGGVETHAVRDGSVHAYPVSSQGGRLLIVLFVPPRIGRRCRAYGDSQQPVNWMSWDATG